MDVKNLITFIHVAEKNSFTKAARVLGYSQSTVSFQIKQLETELTDIKIETEEQNRGRLECGIAYPGTEISFGDEVLRLRKEYRQCVATLVRGEIVLT